MVFDPFGIIQLKAWFYFAGAIIGWFAFYFLIDALKRIEDFTKKKTDWRLIYLSLPLLLISPIAELQSYYFLGRGLGGIEEMIASGFFAMSSVFILVAVYSFKRHLKVKMMMSSTMAVAFFVFFAYGIALLAKVPDFIAFATLVLCSLALFFLAISLWIVGSYTKEFHTIYPMPAFLISSSLILLTSQLVKSYAFANYYFDLQVFTTLDFASGIFIFIGLMIAAISTYVFKKTVIEFKLRIGMSNIKECEKTKTTA